MEENFNDDLWNDIDPQESNQNYYEPEPDPSFNPEDDTIYGDPEEGHQHGDDDVHDNPPAGDDKDLPKDYLSRILRSKGIDREKVRIQNDKGEIEEWNFDDLDEETKYGILSQYESPVTDEEMDEINFLRRQGMSLKDFIDIHRNQAVKEYIEKNTTPKYTVDQVSDDDLYKFDLHDQMPDLTDEEIDEQLAKAKENESFFNKKIAALRNEYKELEDQQAKAANEKYEAEQEAEFQQLANSVITAARNTDEMNGMELDDNDKEEVLDFILNRDASGQSKFYKLFSNPDALFKMAWFALKGDEAFNTLDSYYKNEIAKARRAVKPESKPAQRAVRRQTSSKSRELDPYGLDSVFNKK